MKFQIADWISDCGLWIPYEKAACRARTHHLLRRRLRARAGVRPRHPPVARSTTAPARAGAGRAIVAIEGDRIVARRRPERRRGRRRRSTRRGLAVAPGFINMLSWADDVADRRRPLAERHPAGRHARSVRRGLSMGPLNEQMKNDADRAPGRHQVRHRRGRRSASTSTIWSTRGISPNVASFVGATTVRVHELGYDEPRRRRPTSSSGCGRWCGRRWKRARWASARRSSTRPAFYAKTDELIALCKGRRRIRRHVHLAHAQRGQPAARGGRRADRRSRATRASARRSIT